MSISEGLGPASSQTSLELSNDLNGQDTGYWNQLQSLCFLATPLHPIPNRPPGPEHQYIEEDFKFYQILAMASDLGLSSGLCTMHPLGTSMLHVTPPSRTYSYAPGNTSSKRVADEPWIVPDGQADDSGNHINRSYLRRRPVSEWEVKNDQRFRINFRSIFEQAFERDEAEHYDESITEILEATMNCVKEAKEKGNLAMATFLDLSQIPGFSEDLEQGAPILQQFFQSLQEDEEAEASSALVLSNLTLCPGIEFETLEDSSLPDLLKVYDQVAENWIASLPLRVPDITRLAKFKIARKLAVELCLSSIGVSLRNKASEAPSLPVHDGKEPPDLLQRSAAASREGSPALFSSQISPTPLPESGFGLPTPEQTPSLYSQSHASASELGEDPAILRLRQFAVSIKSKPDLETSKILSHWPAAPGVDPATYSYDAIQRKAAADESGEESDRGKRRDHIRRKRRIERFLSRESTAAAESSSQSGFAPFGSQPDVGHTGFSSQMIDDVPMTQPDRGAFGSRVTQSKTKPKKKKAAGFR
jgi:RNA polymerase I-specific transcription initiation factor RRN6